MLGAIRRCAEANGGQPLGKERFARETGITESQWAGRYWLRWSDVVAEVGYSAGAMNAALPDDQVLGALAQLVQELGRFPVSNELRMRRRTDPAFPSPNVFGRFGAKADLAARLMEHCGGDPRWTDV